MMRQFLTNFFLTYQIKIYGNKIPFLAIRELGPKAYYSKYEVDIILQRWKFNSKYIQIAYALLMTEFDFKRVFRHKGFEYDYLQIRQRIADHFFKGNIEFTICDLLSKSYYRTGAIRKSTPLSSEWKADASYFDCLHSCYEKDLFNIVKYL